MKKVYFYCSKGCGTSWDLDLRDLDKEEQERYTKEEKEKGEDFQGVEWDECGDC